MDKTSLSTKSAEYEKRKNMKVENGNPVLNPWITLQGLGGHEVKSRDFENQSEKTPLLKCQ
jgi:hypothetical protein